MRNPVAALSPRINRIARNATRGFSILGLAALAISGCASNESERAPNRVSSGQLTCFGFDDPGDTFPESALDEHLDVARIPKSQVASFREWQNSKEAESMNLDGEGWIRLSKSSSMVKLGMTDEEFGLVAQVNLTKTDGHWSVASARECSLTESIPGHLVVKVFRPDAGFGNKATSTLRVATLTDLDGCANLKPDFEVFESTASVAVRATYPWDSGSQEVKGHSDEDCAGSVDPRVYELALEKPIGDRKIMQAGWVPNRPVREFDDPIRVPLAE